MGLTLNTSNGQITLPSSTAGNYEVTRTVTNTPSGLFATATDVVTINPADNAAFSYSGSPYDIASASNPTPTVTGLSGGTFNSIDHFEFNGTDDFIDFPVQADFPDVYIMPDDPRTLSVWINPSNINSGTTKVIIANKLWPTLYYQGYSLSMINGGVLQFTFILNKTNVLKYFRVRTTETLSAGNWYNIVLTDNGNLTSATTSATDILNNYNIYINNVPATLTNHSSGLPSGFIGSAANWYGPRLNIGAAEGYTSSGNNTYFPGLISNASIFTESLTSAKVNELYNSGIPGNLSNHSSLSNLVGWWKLGNDATYNSSTSSWSFPNVANSGTGDGTSTSLPSTSIKTIDLNSTTGLISLSNSNVGTYGIVYNTTGATGSLCPETSTQSVQLVNTNFDYPTNVCNATGSPTVLPTNFVQQTGGVFSISPTSGAPGIDATSGLLSPAGSTAGTYAITYTIGSNSTTKNVTSTNVLAPSTTTNTSTLSFNGTSSYIQVENSSVFNLGTNYSFSFWIRNAINTGTQIQGLITCDSSSGAGGTRGWLLFQYGNQLRIAAQDPSGNLVIVSNFFTTNNTWIHVGVTYDGTNFKVYKDGSFFVGSTQSSGAMSLNANNQDLIIGNSAYASGRFFEGKLDEIAIWNTDLTSCDVTGIYQASSNGITADLSTVYPSNLKYYNRMGD